MSDQAINKLEGGDIEKLEEEREQRIAEEIEAVVKERQDEDGEDLSATSFDDRAPY